MKMKNLLLLLSALIVVPAWAGDAAVEPSAPSSTAKQAAPKHKKKKAKKHKAKEAAPAAAIESPSTTTSCVSPCKIMNCPPPSAPLACCHTVPPYNPC